MRDEDPTTPSSTLADMLAILVWLGVLCACVVAVVRGWA